MREMEKETKRHCRKCLTRDMDQNAYFEICTLTSGIWMKR